MRSSWFIRMAENSGMNGKLLGLNLTHGGLSTKWPRSSRIGQPSCPTSVPSCPRDPGGARGPGGCLSAETEPPRSAAQHRLDLSAAALARPWTPSVTTRPGRLCGFPNLRYTSFPSRSLASRSRRRPCSAGGARGRSWRGCPRDLALIVELMPWVPAAPVLRRFPPAGCGT